MRFDLLFLIKFSFDFTATKPFDGGTGYDYAWMCGGKPAVAVYCSIPGLYILWLYWYVGKSHHTLLQTHTVRAVCLFESKIERKIKQMQA